jgi:tetratricopeptide (TPR) repeat protein
MFFDNQSEDQDLNWLREGLADMVITGLSHSRQLNLLSRQQLHLVLERIGHKENEKIRLDEAIDIAHRTKAEAFILGSFARLGDQIRIDVQLYDTKKEQLLGADNLIVQKPEEILTNVDLLSLKIASHLGIMPSSGEQTAELSHVMTSNLDAYRYYSLAVEKAQGLHNKEAIELLQKAIAIDPQFAMAHARIGFAYAVTWNYPDQAKPYLQKAFQLSDRLTDKDKLYISGWYAIANQDYPSAIPYFRKIINQYPFEEEAYVRLGRLLVGEGRYQEGLDCYKRGLLIDPDNKDIYNGLGGLYGSLGNYQDAIEMQRMYVKLAPAEPNSHDSLALTYQNSGYYSQAIEEYNRALALDPDFEVAVVHLGNTYFQMGRYNDAIQQYKRYIAIAPSPKEQMRGVSCISHVYWKKRELSQASQLDSQNPNDATELILIALDLGDQSRAAQLKEKIPPKQDPGRGQRLEMRRYYFPIGYYFLKNGKTSEAIENFKKAIQTAAPIWNIETYEDCLANGYLELHRLDEAIAEYERILRLNPNYPMVHFHLGQAYEAKGEMDRARSEYQNFLQIWKNADSDIPEVKEAKAKLKNIIKL